MQVYQTEENGARILALSRDIISAELKGDSPTLRFAEALQAIPHNGLFVTLRNREALRGCIGTFSGDKGFVETLTDMSRASLRDPRFVDMPVSVSELPRIRIEVSVLSPVVKLSDPLDFEFGLEGVLLERDGHRGCFLPDVGQDLGWDQQMFLSTLCAQKADLGPDAWREPESTLYKFSVWKICE